MKRYSFIWVSTWSGIALVCSGTGCMREMESPSFEAHHDSTELVLPARQTYHAPIRVVCTVGMVADMVRRVGDDRVVVDCLMGPGVDPHRYKPKPSDIRLLRAADVVFYSGLHLEGKMSEILERLGRQKPAIAVAEAIPRDLLLTEDGGVADPHVWFDVSLWRKALARVIQVFELLDPDHREHYASQGRKFDRELIELDEYARRRLSSIPKSSRVLVTPHDAFQYLGRAYDVEVHGIQGISTEDEAGIRRISELVDLIVKRKVKALFAETSLTDRSVRALEEGSRARGWSIHLGESLFSDALGDSDSPEGTYIGMVKHNVDAIVSALQ